MWKKEKEEKGGREEERKGSKEKENYPKTGALALP